MPLLLTDLELKTTYRSGRDSLLKDFYIPALKRASKYQRSVGYFTSASLAHAAKGLSALIQGGGKLELIASPKLTEDDIQAIIDGYARKEELAIEVIRASLKDCENQLVSSRLGMLSTLIAAERLKIKLAIPIDAYGNVKPGIYHEKIGVISDCEDNYISFRGSSNETEGGLVTNFESTSVFWSWEDFQDRAKEQLDNFINLWGNNTPGLEVLDFTEVTADLLQPYRPTRTTSIEAEIELEEVIERAQPSRPPVIRDGELRLPNGIKLRDYQERAINNWFRANGRGIYSLATGTGKTITALATATRLRVARRLDAVLVLCPYQNLVRQWSSELRSFGVDPICAFHSRQLWQDRLTTEILRPRNDSTPLLAVVSTFATFSTPAFQDLLPQFPARSMMIADEAHHVGAESLHGQLPSTGFPFRLALSATPERWQDEEGTSRILNWFGQILEPQISVADAIANGSLTPYFYYPEFIHLDESEAVYYQEITAKIAALIAQGHEFSTSRQLGILVHKRARFLATLKGKTDALSEIIRNKETVERTLVYCGSGSFSTGDGDTDESTRHVEHIVQLLSNDLDVRSATYIAETPLNIRESRIQMLISGDIQAIVAINCLDEGVDIPCIDTAIILSSSANPRQFIQRRGRVLRNFDGKEHATIHDMIVVPTANTNPSDAERRLMERELSRYLEFARDAINNIEAEGKILPLLEQYGLLHL